MLLAPVRPLGPPYLYTENEATHFKAPVSTIPKWRYPITLGVHHPKHSCKLVSLVRRAVGGIAMPGFVA